MMTVLQWMFLLLFIIFREGWTALKYSFNMRAKWESADLRETSADQVSLGACSTHNMCFWSAAPLCCAQTETALNSLRRDCERAEPLTKPGSFSTCHSCLIPDLETEMGFMQIQQRCFPISPTWGWCSDSPDQSLWKNTPGFPCGGKPCACPAQVTLPQTAS